ncbi:hypothetical protein F5148DRAFT_1236722 [Russula earlei]|uniref:Uncharacterized protein n=1 Tax=Russula earlei TaxID=71964 RepID=A0ACC0TWZ4_9AGAM|nr:hypothetical protein F5148DRAFT_1236722 [Russula earlei]
MVSGYCPIAVNGDICTDTLCFKRHDIAYCRTCKCSFPPSSQQQHENGSRHRLNVSSNNPPSSGLPWVALPPVQSTPSNRSSSPSAFQPYYFPPSWGPGNRSTPDSDSRVTESSTDGPRTKVPYCATSLQGDTCVDSRCTYSHDILRCEVCGRSFPAPLLKQHQSGTNHLQKAAPNGLTNPSTSQQPHLSQTPSQNSQSIPPRVLVPPPKGKLPTSTVNPGFTVTHEDGLDFFAEGTGTPADPSFPSVSDIILIENINPVSTLSIQSMTLSPSPSPCFLASLLGKTKDVRQNSPRKVVVSFNAPCAGTYLATLRITFCDKSRLNDQEFIITRELHGCANPPGGEESSEEFMDFGTDEEEEEGEGTGIAVSPNFGLKFFIERSRSDEPFETQTKNLVITKSSVQPLVFFKAARVFSPHDAMASLYSTRLEGDSKWIKHNRQRKLTVAFTPQQEGYYVATLELTFGNHKCKTDFVIRRRLCGFAKRRTGGKEQQQSARDPESQSINDRVDDHATVLSDDEELLDIDGTGIFVSHPDGLDFGIVDRKRPNGPFATPSALLTIKLADGFPAVTFVKRRTRILEGSDSEFEAVFEGNSHDIQPGTENKVRVIFSPKFEGVYKATLNLVFYHRRRSAWFAVRRELRGIAGSLEDHKHFESLSQGNDDRTGSSRETLPRQIIRLFSPDWHQRPKNIPDYELPSIVQEAVDKSTTIHSYEQYALDLISILRPESLDEHTYLSYYKALLNIEDGHQRRDVLCQPSHTVEVQMHGQRYSVEIESNDEDLLPEVALGELLWLDDSQDNIRYEARVTDVDVFTRHHLAVLRMWLRLPTAFNLYLGAQFVLRFRHNRITLRRQYHALIALFSPSRRLLFPAVSDIKSMKCLSNDEISNLKVRQLVNKNLRDEQVQTVISILEQPQGSVPFIIYGLPGTGKTSIIVESIMQLVRRDPCVRVLACAPSNVAANVLAGRLEAVGLDSDKLYRLNVPAYCEDISEDVRTFSLIPGHDRLLAFRVVLSTCSEASILQTLNVPIGHFSHIVIDEAAQAEEPLAMIPIMTFANAQTIVVLAGDPKQLRPIVKSPAASKAGLGISYLERLLFMREVYGLDIQDGKTIVNLRRNRRSHAAIIAWSNRYLYEDCMREYGNAYNTYDLILSDVLPKKGFPVVFHGVRGSEERTTWSPSYFNVLEASIVRNYCVKLTGDPERRIHPEEIGVLAPYKAQVRAIRELLKATELSGILVGPVEQFQGQERKVLILTTTRNEESHSRKDLGFLANRHNMNVAFTRAQALLIVVGDPEVLGKDELWRTFLNYVKSRKGWTGKLPNWNQEEEVSVPGCKVVSRIGDVVYGEEFIGGKSEDLYTFRE